MNEEIFLNGARVTGLGFGQPGDWFYTRIVWPGDVKQAKQRVDATFQSVNRDVQACAGLSADEKAAWSGIFSAWRQLYCGSSMSCTEPAESLFGLGGQMDDVERYEKIAYDWQNTLATKCTLSSPIEKPDAVKREEAAKSTDWTATVKTVAVAVVVTTSIVYLVPQIGKLVPERRR